MKHSQREYSYFHVLNVTPKVIGLLRCITKKSDLLTYQSSVFFFRKAYYH